MRLAVAFALLALPAQAQGVSVIKLAEVIGMASGCGIAIDEAKAVAKITARIDPLDPLPTTSIAGVVALGKSQIGMMDSLSRAATCEGIALHVKALGLVE